jgi:hypothetical protein
METLFASIREPHQRFGNSYAGRSKGSGHSDEGDDNGSDDETERSQDTRQTEKLLASFERLFDQLISKENCGAFDLVAFDLTQYIVERLEPDAPCSEAWLRTLVRGFSRYGVPSDRLGDIVGATLVLHSLGHRTPDEDQTARARLLQWNVDFAQGTPDLSGARAFVHALAPSTDFDPIWRQLQKTKSLPEQVNAYLRAFETRQPADNYLDLPISAPDCWPVLEAAISDDEMRDQILLITQPSYYCPKCYTALTPQDASDLETIGVALARNCCGRVLILRGK